MKALIKLEEFSQFLLGIVLFSQLDFAWWWFPALILIPDVSMLGYTVNPRTGAMIYNLFHHKALGIAFVIMGVFFLGEIITLVGIILFSHSAMDRIFGYGLKYPDSFKNTHLGRIGK